MFAWRGGAKMLGLGMPLALFVLWRPDANVTDPLEIFEALKALADSPPVSKRIKKQTSTVRSAEGSTAAEVRTSARSSELWSPKLVGRADGFITMFYT
jgi:hypothetical protein